MNENEGKCVSLRLIYNAIDSADDMYFQYLDTEKMEVIMIPSPDNYFVERDEDDEKLMDQIEMDEDNRFLELPSKYDIHEYHIMEEFIIQLRDPRLREELFNAIHGKGAFRRFKSKAAYYGILQDWYDYRDRYFRALAQKWCEEKNLEYIDDLKQANADFYNSLL